MGKWSEIVLEKKLWRIPAKRMKMRLDHLVPLSAQAYAILEELRELAGRGRLMFPGLRSSERAISDATFIAALRRMGLEKDEMCAHSFRSMASTILNEKAIPLMSWISSLPTIRATRYVVTTAPSICRNTGRCCRIGLTISIYYEKLDNGFLSMKAFPYRAVGGSE